VTYAPSPFRLVREQVERYEASDGAEGHEMNGWPCVVVTHVGRRTGHVRKTPLIRVVHEGQYVLVGSMGGQPTDPVWCHNIRANPHIEVRDRATTHEVVVREVTDPDQRAAAWASATAAYPPYDEYQARTERTIPVFVCEPR
jgi:deazaflavin-dependent oxidoreductase (nitroreductase family)